MVSPVAELEDRVQEIEEKLRWFHDAMKMAADQFVVFRHMNLSWSDKTILHALYTVPATLTHETIRRRLDVVLDRQDESGIMSVNVAVYRLRKRLQRLDPPIEISNERGVGFYLDDENKARLAEIMRKKR